MNFIVSIINYFSMSEFQNKEKRPKCMLELINNVISLVL